MYGKARRSHRYSSRLILAGCGIVCLLLGAPALAEEGGGGHYLPGSMASFVDAVPPAETFIVRYNRVNYNGDYHTSQPLPVAGLKAAGLDADVWVHGLTMLWRPPLEIGEGFSYAMSATLPYLFVEVSGQHTIEIDTDIQGPGKAGTATLVVDGKEVGKAQLKQTVPAAFTATESFDVGVDLGSPVSLNYYDRRPFAFEGTILEVDVTLK